MDEGQLDITPVFSNIATQLRSVMSNLHLAAAQLAPAEARDLDPELDAKAAVLDQSYYQLLRLVNNLTAASSLGRKDPLPLRDGDLVETVRALCEPARSLAALKGIQLEFLCRTEHHICAFHRPSIETVLYQLISNALKFMEKREGEKNFILVDLRFVKQRVRLAVIDNGTGVPEDQIPFLFDRFLHADAVAVQPYGLGLGLPICQHIAEQHGGTMMADSMPGQGARFTLSFPDRRCGTLDVSDVKFDYSGGFNPVLLALSDGLPVQAFLQRNLD